MGVTWGAYLKRREESCCVCPIECESDETGETCLDSRCAFCLHGCPAVDPATCCGWWTVVSPKK